MPSPDTEVSTAPSSTQVRLSRISWSWNKKKAARFPINPEVFNMAQKMPEFLVIVSSSELLARKVPCNNYISRNC